MSLAIAQGAPSSISLYAEDLIQAIKIVHSTEQESDRIPQKAAAYLTYEFVKMIPDYEEEDVMDELIQAFREACDSRQLIAQT
jgi:hypothetical protein